MVWVRGLSGLVVRLFNTRSGRFLLLASVSASTLIVFRERVIDYLGWSFLPLLAWYGTVLFIVLVVPFQRWRNHWRIGPGSLLSVASVAAILGIVDSESSSMHITMSGWAGEWLARRPLDWEGIDPNFNELAQAIVRAASLAVLSFGVMLPNQLWSATLNIAQSTSHAAGACSRAVKISWAACNQYRQRRASKGTVKRETTEMVAISLLEGAIATEAQHEKTAETIASDTEGAQGDEKTTPTTTVVLDETPEHKSAPVDNWMLPSIEMLKQTKLSGVSKSETEATGQLIVDTLADHGIEVSIGQVRTGPVVTMYGLVPGYGRKARINAGQGQQTSTRMPGNRVRVDTILAREKDLALALASPSLRFEAPVPGESVVGVEVPNAHPSAVALRSVMDTQDFRSFAYKAALPAALGVGSDGEPVYADLSRMPHMLVAGSTGSGKSVCINALLAGLLLSRTPEELRLILVDPKRVELTPYQGIPHLYTPPVVEGDRALTVLKSVVAEMMERFKTLESSGTKNIASYNQKAITKMPYLLVVVDELADLMLTSANEVERTLVRLAQLGRATGVHLVVATQRPSVDVVTGLIKANFPSRVAFSVSSQVDSRTILDSPGAEKLLGQGDMLFLPVDRPKPSRIQGAFVSDPEVESLVSFWRMTRGPTLPQLEITLENNPTIEPGRSSGEDSLFDQAVSLARSQSRLSTSLLQRRLRIGYPRAARLMDELEEANIVGPGETGKPRIVLGQ